MVRALLSRTLLTLLVLFLGGAALSGCKSNCRQLSEKLCECSTNSQEKDACIRRASSSDSTYADQLDEKTEAFCESKLESCDCHLVDTPEGKERCGLSRGP